MLNEFGKWCKTLSEPGKGKLIIVSGPSGVGKGTILKQVMQQSAHPLVLNVSATTRTPRAGEENGVHYWFLTRDEFQRRRENGEFLECFEVFQGGDWYGTLRSHVESELDSGKWVILEIDVQGALAVSRTFPGAISIFIEPKSIEVLRERLLGRGTESAEKIGKRLQRAEEELRFAEQYDYRIVNDDLDRAVHDFLAKLGE
ncbi:MAG: guanylate kinase [Thermoguttaceae bacterium]